MWVDIFPPPPPPFFFLPLRPNAAILHLDAGKVLTIEAGLTHTGTIAVEIASHDAVGAVNVTGAVELFGAFAFAWNAAVVSHRPAIG